MKKVILILTVVITSLTVNAQNTTQTQPQKSKVYYSFAWGLFKSENYQNNKVAKLEIQKPTVLVKPKIDTTEYEVKSILWGTIEWTEKRKILHYQKTKVTKNTK